MEGMATPDFICLKGSSTGAEAGVAGAAGAEAAGFLTGISKRSSRDICVARLDAGGVVEGGGAVKTGVGMALNLGWGLGVDAGSTEAGLWPLHSEQMGLPASMSRQSKQ
jgi:hypothetical protein